MYWLMTTLQLPKVVIISDTHCSVAVAAKILEDICPSCPRQNLEDICVKISQMVDPMTKSHYYHPTK